MGPAASLLLLSAAAFDASGAGAPIYVGRNSDLSMRLDVGEVQEEGTITVTIETAGSAAATRWRKLGAFAAATATGQLELELAGASPWVRARYEVESGAFAAYVHGDAQLVLRAPTTVTASGVSAVVDVAQYRSGVFGLSATAGTGTLDVSIETASSATAPNGAWRPVATFPQATGPAELELRTPGLERFVRVRWVIAGTDASFTFGVAGESQFTLVTPYDRVRLGMKGGAMPGWTIAELDDRLVAASKVVLGYLTHYSFPLIAWGDDLRRAAIAIAEYLALGDLGGEPGKEHSGAWYVARYRDNIGEPPQRLGWLDLVRKGDVRPDGIIDSSAPTEDPRGRAIPIIQSRPRRGWGRPR